jgi:hypothetical protein
MNTTICHHFFRSYSYERLFPRVYRKTYSKDGKRNLYPILRKRIGITRELDRIAALANSSPNADFIMNSGIENIVGRDKNGIVFHSLFQN